MGVLGVLNSLSSNTGDPIGGPGPLDDGWNHIEAVKYFAGS